MDQDVTHCDQQQEPEPSSSTGGPRTVWAADMRRRFSPPSMLDSQGNIVQEFFKPKCVLLVNEKRWGAAETDLLYVGLERYGVGRWHEISSELLPAWDDQQVRVRAAKLLGSQSLARYSGWKGSRSAVQDEYAHNKGVGEATGCWKHGMLVEDNEGSVKQYFDSHTGRPEQRADVPGEAIGPT